MRVCPQCARKNKPQAKFCDLCGFEFVGYASSAAPTQQVDPPPAVDRLPPGDTAKGLPPALAGVPQEVRGGKGIYRQTQKINAPAVDTGTPTARSSHNEQTIKLARVPAPANMPANPPAPQPVTAPFSEENPSGASVDPEPEATIQGAFYLRRQEAVRAASAGEHVGWLVELVGIDRAPGSIWPVTTGLTLIGSGQAEVGHSIVLERPGLATAHALLYHRYGKTWLLDLDSGNPTGCNGEALPPMQGHPLSERDELHLGELVLSFRRVDPQPPPET